MRRKAVWTVVLGLMCGGSAAAQQREGHTGTDLLKDCTVAARVDTNKSWAEISQTNKCESYILGFWDADAMHRVRGNPTLKCMPDGVTLGQGLLVVLKYLQDHPEKLHLDQAVLTTQAFEKAFPCTK
jgi:hypothetical protein